ncbi:hypothetical protein [Sphingomonas sp. CROZ-RG-20F-R02-07]|uniref:hypothetical protein n=1 Tax=Sphingomonas sp. CROZ-RG-20F-R02-07 TaxID=2914832 RepID=UPI001F55F9BD|nr:hypothetical protein [Sphingomonas sp. CROZ-RG-20F-R02-07]
MATAEPIYLPTLPRVRQAMATLIGLGAHRSVAGYLAVLNEAATAQREDKLRPDFRAFFDRFFRIGDPPQKKPYAVPLTTNPNSILFNANVAGSYAPSSIRPVSPLYNVLTIEGGGTQAVFTLREHHAELARQTMLPEALPLYAFATFFYRDFGFDSLPTRAVIEQAVSRDFCFALGGEPYGHGLFADDFATFSAADYEQIEIAA